MDNLTKQIEEIETLVAIYGSDFQTEDEVNRAYSITIAGEFDHLNVKLYVKFSETYPSLSPPTFEISAPHLKQDKKTHLTNVLNEVYLENVGEPVVFQCIEKIREELHSDFFKAEVLVPEDESEVVEAVEIVPESKKIEFECPTIFHGEIILDRKSTFQGHAAAVFSVEQTRQVLNKLKENKKILQATHNISAYRIYNESNKIFIHDCDDDGESQAGSRLLHLLEVMDAKNVMVVVSRWYGGIHLGPDRFKHINNAARQILTTSNLVQTR